MKTTFVYHRFTSSKNVPYLEPYKVTIGLAEELIKRWPQYYSLKKEDSYENN
jgi:hypothetical protein